jgi:ATPase subunit of ABC transporter with duplicated ATPase domains
VLQSYQRRKRQERSIEAWHDSFASIGGNLRRLAEESVAEELDAQYFDSKIEEDDGVLAITLAAAEKLTALKDRIVELAAFADQITADSSAAIQRSKWKEALATAEDSYRALAEKLKGAEAGDPSEYGRLVQERQALESKLARSEGQRQTASDIRKQTADSLERLAEIRRDLTRRRSNFLTTVVGNNPHVRIEVIAYGSSKANVESQFREIIGKIAPTFQSDILTEDGNGGLLGELYGGYPGPTRSLQSFEQELAQLKKKLVAWASGTGGALARDQRFVNYLSTLRPEAFDRLDSWFPDDSLRVTYSPRTDGTDFKPIEQGSPGQKTAAILAFLLAYGEEPIVLDQPEDDLDNHLIYELIVRQIRETKQRRQVIVVTHNPNIVVNGDAEFVVALDVRGGQTRAIVQGGLQEQRVRDEICRVMEGGREAFELRYRRIALGGQIV